MFKWKKDDSEEPIIFRMQRARDEPNAVIWENAVCEPAEISRAHLIVKSSLFVIVVICFILLFLVMD